MTTVGQREIRVQARVIDFFHDVLGYEYLGNWKDRADNANTPTGTDRHDRSKRFFR
ncbi:MAG: hypothetical protein KatS3mg051_2191 [Anaerolineae bacterium]|nr:MAG: hypothetical protein KatS3mg051_2191 [Anaerolineae bacterium]